MEPSAKRAFLVTDYLVSIPVCMPWGINSELVGSTKEKVQRRYRGLRWLLVERCCSRRSATLAKLQHAGGARSEQVWLVRLGSAPSPGCIATGRVRDQQAWPLVSYVLVLAVLSREEQCSEVQRLLHVVQGCSPCATCAAPNRRPLPSRCCSGRRWRGKRTHSVEMPSEEKQGR